MKILITGAKGFIGNYFLKKYNEKYNIKRFSFRSDILEKFNLNRMNTIIHLSALVHQMGGASQEEYEYVNVTQTLLLAKKAKSEGVKHFIFMSTVKVYGEETDVPYNENSKCAPQDDYGKSKLKAEQELQKLQDENFIVSIIRTPIVYGFGVKANIENLVNLITKVPILPFDGISNRRSMVYIGNLCHLIDEIIRQKQTGVFLATDDESLSISHLIKLISDSLNKKIYLIKIPFFDRVLKLVKPSFYHRLFCSLEVDNSITKNKLNLKNPYNVDDAMRYMIQGEK